ncbi:MAG: matrixin family metalloprotease [Isosphaeraceae bacterium]
MHWLALQTLGERLFWGRREDGRGARRGASREDRLTASHRHEPALEPLEDRRLLATPGYDYVLSGLRWENPSRITYSVAPDGVFWDHGTNNLNARFDATLGAGTWRRELARALATWQSVANLNIVPVADGSHDLNTLGYAQGDARFGDIRIGGYLFPNNERTLAQTFFPPPNGSTAAGDLEINTALDFRIGSTYDLYSVVLHETGHSLGLEHPPSPSVVMTPNYGGIRQGLTEGDIAGIQAIYGPRTLDAYQRNGQGLAGSPIDASAALGSGTSTTIANLGLPGIGSSEYFTFQAPSDAAGILTITAQASGVSMLSPKLSVFDDAGNLVGEAATPTSWSNDVTVSASGVVPGKRYSIVVTGATQDVFSVGAYVLTLALPGRTGPPGGFAPPPGGNTTPPTTVPVSTTILPDRYELNGTRASAAWLGRIAQTSLGGLTFTNGTDVDFFSFQAGRTGSFRITASGAVIQVYSARGKLLSRGVSLVNTASVRSGTVLYVKMSPSGGAGVPGYSLSISAATIAALGRRPRFLFAARRR